MNTKIAVLLGVFLLSLSSVAAQGNVTNSSLGNLTDDQYDEVVREAGDLPSLAHMEAVYDGFGVPLAVVVLLPILVFLLAGAFEGEWERREYWIMVVLAGFTAVLSLIGFPLLLIYL